MEPVQLGSWTCSRPAARWAGLTMMLSGEWGRIWGLLGVGFQYGEVQGSPCWGVLGVQSTALGALDVWDF